jgi:hypothetical protein
MASSVNSTYALTTSGTWIVPLGVSSITVECFGSVVSGQSSANCGLGFTSGRAARSGASYSKSTTIAVTAGQTFYYNIGAAGGVTWFNTANSQPVVGVNTTTTSCLAVGGNTASTAQVAANIGDVKYAGGAGVVSTGSTFSGTGGNAGPNGAGAAAGVPYSNTADSTGYIYGCGGGGNGGSVGGLGVLPYGRTGSGVTVGAGNGAYWTGSAFIDRTKDFTYSSDYLANAPQFSTTNYGTFGGSSVKRVNVYCSCGNYDIYQYDGNDGFIIITLNSPTQLSIVNSGTGNFVVPATFGSLISIEAQGLGVYSSSNGGGGGGGAYSKTNVASITTSIVAGSTVVYYQNSNPECWLRIGTNSAPSFVTDGVLAKSGSLGGSVVGGAGGLASAGIGDVKFSGGNGGDGFSSVAYIRGGGGGSAGPDSAGGDGGAGYTASSSKGSGGGGAANNTAAGNAGTLTAGGAGANGLGTGGAGGTSSLTGRDGTNGGGGGGGFGSNNGGSGGFLLINGIYSIKAGGGGNNATFGGGAGGGGGVTIFTYSPATAGGANTSNFLVFF